MLIIPSYIGLWFLQILCILFPLVLYQSYFRKRFIHKRMQRVIYMVMNGLSIFICMTFPVSTNEGYLLDLRYIPLIIAFILNYLTLWAVIHHQNTFHEMEVISEKVIQFEKNHTINHLLVNISQQMLSPLRSANYYLELIEKDQLTKHQSLHLIQAKSELTQAENCLNHYLTCMDEKWHEPTEMSFVKELQDVVKLMKSYAHIHQVELIFTSTAEEDVSIKGNPGMLRFALLNIIKNGIEACSPKGCVNISLHEMIKDVYIVIEDNGNGIPNQVLSQLGKPLTSGKVNGTGLGLASTYKITESMGGRVEVESDVNKGTVFSLYFPKWASLEV